MMYRKGLGAGMEFIEGPVAISLLIEEPTEDDKEQL